MIDFAREFLPELKRGIQNKIITNLKNSIDKSYEIIKYNHNYLLNVQRFNVLNDFCEELVNNTIYTSICTAIIIFCLTIIPPGKWLMCYPSDLYVLIVLVVLSLIIIFYLLITILKSQLSVNTLQFEIYIIRPFYWLCS